MGDISECFWKAAKIRNKQSKTVAVKLIVFGGGISDCYTILLTNPATE